MSWNTGTPAPFPQLPDGCESIAAGHPEVHQYEVGIVLGHDGQGLGAAPGLSDHIYVFLQGEDPGEAVPDDWVIVHHH